jgi:hypothetical protein
MPRRASLKRVECPILFRATPQPSTGRRSVRSKANPNKERQGILETTHRHPQPYEHNPSRSHDHHHSGQSGARASLDDDGRIDYYRIAVGVDAVRVTHLPTGIAVSVDDQPTAETNRRRAIELLRAQVDARSR